MAHTLCCAHVIISIENEMLVSQKIVLPAAHAVPAKITTTRQVCAFAVLHSYSIMFSVQVAILFCSTFLWLAIVSLLWLCLL